MVTVTETVRALAVENPLIRAGLSHRLLNLSRVARFLQPLVRARLQRDVTVSSILMSLSRIQREGLSEGDGIDHPFEVNRIHVHSGLSTLTVSRTPETHRVVQRFVSDVQQAGGYLTYTEGTQEITVIVETAFLKYLDDAGGLVPKRLQRQIAGIGVTFHETYAEQPGFLYRMLQQIALQQINVIEIHSTMTEFTVYVKQEDVRLTFDSIFYSFAKQD